MWPLCGLTLCKSVNLCRVANYVSLNINLSLWCISLRAISEFLCVFLLGKMSKDECAFLRGQLVLFLSRLFQQLLPHHSEHRTQQRPAEDLSGLVPRQTVAELRHIAVAKPSIAQT